MEGFEKRLKEERDDLEKKIAKLLMFIKSDKFKSLPEEDRFLLDMRSSCMESYLTFLEQRIKRLDLNL